MTKYKDFTEDDIKTLRAGCEEWQYFPMLIGLDALAKIEALTLQGQDYKGSADLWATRWSRLKDNFDKLLLQNRELNEACEKAAAFLQFDQPRGQGSVGDVIAKLYRAINLGAEKQAGEVPKSVPIPVCPNCGLLSDGRKCKCGWIR